MLPTYLLEEDLEPGPVDGALLDLDDLQASAIGDGGDDRVVALVVLLAVNHEWLPHGTPAQYWQGRLGEADLIQVHDVEAAPDVVIELLKRLPCLGIYPLEVRLCHHLLLLQHLPPDHVPLVDLPDLVDGDPHLWVLPMEACTAPSQTEVGLQS